MPNVVSQSCGPEGIEIVFSGGEVVRISTSEIRSRHLLSRNPFRPRGDKNAVVAWARQRVEQRKPDMIRGDEIEIDYDEDTGVPISLEIRG